MNIESIRLENKIQAVPKQENSPKLNTQIQSNIVQSIQQIKQQMVMDPSYQPTLQEKTILNAIDEINIKLAGQDIQVEVDFHEKTKEMIVRLVDKKSKEIIREIPSEKIIDMVASLCEIAGLYIDEKR